MLGWKFNFQQSKTSKQKPGATIEWFRSQQICLLQRPSQSTRLELSQELRTDVYRHSLSKLTEGWKFLPLDVKSVEALPRRRSIQMHNTLFLSLTHKTLSFHFTVKTNKKWVKTPVFFPSHRTAEWRHNVSRLIFIVRCLTCGTLRHHTAEIFRAPLINVIHARILQVCVSEGASVCGILSGSS